MLAATLQLRSAWIASTRSFVYRCGTRSTRFSDSSEKRGASFQTSSYTQSRGNYLKNTRCIEANSAAPNVNGHALSSVSSLKNQQEIDLKAPKSTKKQKTEIDKSQPHPDLPGHYHVETMAKILNITARRLQQLASAGDVPKGKNGGYYPLLETVNRYCKYLQERSKGRPASEMTEQAIQIQAERKRKLKMENDFRSGKMVDVTLVENMAMEVAVAISNSLDGVAGRIAGGDAVMRQRIFNEHRRIRETIGHRLQALARAGSDGADDNPAAAALTVAMGGSEKGTTEG